MTQRHPRRCCFVWSAAAALALWLAAASGAVGADAFVGSVRLVRPSVVGIGSYDPRDTPGIVYQGTGFVFDDGTVIATNAHVVAGVRTRDRLPQMRAFFADGAADGRRVSVLGEDVFHDVAVLGLEGAPAPAVKLEYTDAPAQGQDVGIIGYPIGLQLGLVPAAHRGVVAAVVPAVLPMPKGVKLTPELAEAIRRPYNLYQLDMVVYPGNSGSPLFNAADGRVLGIINKTLATRTREHLLTNPSGIAYAVPSRWIEELLLRIKASAKNQDGAGPSVGSP